ncbi:MAG: FtsX-like permease family protein, partial [Dehalococcoidia bacterium]
DVGYLSRLLGEAQAVSALQLAVDPAQVDNLYRAIKKLPNAQGLSVRGNTKENLESTLVETMSFFHGLLIAFAGVIAFGSVLNSSLIEIGDRARDIATFRVLGYKPGQVAGIFFRQNMVVFFVGLALAVPLGLGMIYGSAAAYDMELFRMPVVLKPRAFILTGLISMVFVLAAQWFVHRAIGKLDWAAGVKISE